MDIVKLICNDDSKQLKKALCASNLMSRYKGGETMLHLACNRKKTGCLKTVIDAIKLRRKNDMRELFCAKNKTCMTPLMVAVYANNYMCVFELLRAIEVGTDLLLTILSIKDAKGRTPLMVAALHGYQRTVKILLDAGFLQQQLLEHRGERGMTALMYANADTCDVIMDAWDLHSQLITQNEMGHTAFVNALFMHNDECARRIVSKCYNSVLFSTFTHIMDSIGGGMCRSMLYTALSVAVDLDDLIIRSGEDFSVICAHCCVGIPTEDEIEELMRQPGEGNEWNLFALLKRYQQHPDSRIKTFIETKLMGDATIQWSTKMVVWNRLGTT